MGKLTYLGHASFLIESSWYKIVLDPYGKSSVPFMEFPKKSVPEVDAVFCSHNHLDHAATNLVKVKLMKPVVLKPVLSLVPHDHHEGHKRGLNTIRMFDVDGIKVVHLGDIGCIPKPNLLEPFKKCDILLAPINGHFTIDSNELVEIVKMIEPRIVIPMHYFMKEYNSGYPDKDAIREFEKLFPNHQYLETPVLDLQEYKDYTGALIFKKYVQD